MPKPKLYDKRETLRLTSKMDRDIELLRKTFNLRRGEAIRLLIAIGLDAPRKVEEWTALKKEADLNQ